jgi:hypothetical protein
VVQDTAQLRALAYVVMHLKIPYKARNAFVIWGTINFPWRTLRHEIGLYWVDKEVERGSISIQYREIRLWELKKTTKTLRVKTTQSILNRFPAESNSGTLLLHELFRWTQGKVYWKKMKPYSINRLKIILHYVKWKEYSRMKYTYLLN